MLGSKKIFISFMLVCLLLLQGCVAHNAYLYNQAIVYYSYAQYNRAFDLFGPLARSGDPNSQYALGYLYYYGLGTVEDQLRAEFWFNEAAMQGQPLAKRSLCLIDRNRVLYDRKPHKIITIY